MKQYDNIVNSEHDFCTIKTTGEICKIVAYDVIYDCYKILTNGVELWYDSLELDNFIIKGE
jgi:hypothetical protein